MSTLLPRTVFVTGATGYLGRPLVARLLARGHQVRALVRPGSEPRLPPGAVPIVDDALRAETFADAVAPADFLVHLGGIPRPSPAKAAAFRGWTSPPSRPRSKRPSSAASGISFTSAWLTRRRSCGPTSRFARRASG